MTTTFGLLSDLHLESSNMDAIPNPGWDFLILAGDISTDFNLLYTFLQYKLPHIPTFYVLGNHEYEQRLFPSTIPTLRTLLQDLPHITILDNEVAYFNNIQIIGSTLWSDFNLYGPSSQLQNAHDSRLFPDFQSIYVPLGATSPTEKQKYRKFTPNDCIDLSQSAQSFLHHHLRTLPHNGPRIVATHFAPHPLSIAPHFRHSNSSYWINNLPHLLGFSDFWLHGHTHSSANYSVHNFGSVPSGANRLRGTTTVISNPRGYSPTFNLHQNQTFNPSLILSIDDTNTYK